MRVENRDFPPFIAKSVEGIFGYDILLYGFLFRRQWESFSRIGLLFIKWRRVKHKAARARTFLVRLAPSISYAAVYKLWFTFEKQEKIYIYVSHSFLCIYNTIICFKNNFFLEYAHMYNINVYSRMWIFSYHSKLNNKSYCSFY